ncbi:MAG: hypothetical protein IAE82_20225 [Opitutaceae bacterium]|nr:hypothetical protein [Opitutaceae bacterium]
MKIGRQLVTLLPILAVASASCPAAQWRYSFGVSNQRVPEVDSDTFGIAGTLIVEDTTPSGVHLYGEGELFVDHDQDHLDPDHIPVWWRTHLFADGRIWEISDSLDIGWIAESSTKANTVSSVEREIKILPGLTANFRSGPFAASAKVASGMFFLEIDDDVPKERGYARGDFRNTVMAVSYAANASIELGQSCRLRGQVQTWRDPDGWLENQVVIDLHYDLSRWMADSALIFGFEHTEYNLAVYTPADAGDDPLPILPWDHDQFFKLALEKLW